MLINDYILFNDEIKQDDRSKESFGFEWKNSVNEFST